MAEVILLVESKDDKQVIKALAEHHGFPPGGLSFEEGEGDAGSWV